LKAKVQNLSSLGVKYPWAHLRNDDMHFVSKGWGFERWIVNNSEYCGKLLHIDNQKKCSWHYHILKDEVFYVVSGTLKVVYGHNDDKQNAETLFLTQGEGFHVGRGLRHQMTAVDGDCEFFEFSTQHFDEDSIRIEKGD
jgi:mannose-6-phosphate isomerase-like protein (cupin superfamily)